MTRNEHIVISNLLGRISRESYGAVEEMMNKPISKLNEEDIGGLLTIFKKEINSGKAYFNESITDILLNADYLNKFELNFMLMHIAIDNYNIKELESFINKQITLLQNDTGEEYKPVTKSKKKCKEKNQK